MNNIAKKRNIYLDAIRGVACFLVIFIHRPFPGTVGHIISAIARAGVAIFFIISGYYTYNTIADCNFNNNVADNGSAIKLTKYLCPTNCYFNGQNKNYNKYFYIENKLSPELSVNAYDIHLNEVLKHKR